MLYQCLSPGKIQTVYDCISEYDHQIVRVIVSRGQATDDSDIDLPVVIKSKDYRIRGQLIRHAHDIFLENRATDLCRGSSPSSRKDVRASIYSDSGKDHTYESCQFRSVIRQFVHLAHERYPHEIETIILYGSVARGDAGPDSDIDLLVLWKGDDREGWRAMTGIAFDVMIATESHISVKVMGADTFSGSFRFRTKCDARGDHDCVIGILALPGRGIVAPGSSRSHSPPTSVKISPARRE